MATPVSKDKNNESHDQFEAIGDMTDRVLDQVDKCASAKICTPPPMELAELLKHVEHQRQKNERVLTRLESK